MEDSRNVVGKVDCGRSENEESCNKLVDFNKRIIFSYAQYSSVHRQPTNH